MTLTEFLMARIAEDEQRAVPWHPAEGVIGTLGGFDEVTMFERRGFSDRLTHAEAVERGWLVPGEARARALAECEAKRRIVEREGKRLHEQWRRHSDEHRQTFDEWFTKPYGETLRDLAAVYADHPDYREEWRP